MSLEIRKIKKEDKELFLSYPHRFYHSEAVLHPTDSQLHLNIFNELMRSEDYLVSYLFSLDGEDAGYALLSKCFCPEVGGSIVWIEQLYINEGCRKKGIASEFLTFIERQFGPDRIRLEVEEDNEGAISLYKKKGYRFLPYLQMVKDKK
jgi:ribosomal protein S18 acetylase RimI-like enzyme